MTVTDALLVPLLAADAGRPRITFYDDATGERVELSGTTVANWTAKTANLLRDELDVQPGSRVAVLLPAHWQSAAALLGAWWCGGHVVADAAGAEVALCDGARLGDAAGAAAVVALSLDALGRGLPDLPAGVVDYAGQVPVHGDEFVPWQPLPGQAPALQGCTVDEVVAMARQRATALGLSAGDRVMSTLDWPVPDGVLDGLLAVLAVGGSLVQCRHPDPAALARRAAVERVTRTLPAPADRPGS